MKCPKCGKEMKIGEVSNRRGENCFWAPSEYFNKYYLPRAFHRNKTIEAEGGIVIKIKNRVLSEPTVGYACADCKVVVIDCNQ